jgi:hypothetical protein
MPRDMLFEVIRARVIAWRKLYGLGSDRTS